MTASTDQLFLLKTFFWTFGVLFFGFSEPLSAKNNPSPFISAADFKALPVHRQTEYLKQIQKILAEMDQRGDFFAHSESSPQRFPASEPSNPLTEAQNKIQQVESLLYQARNGSNNSSELFRLLDEAAGELGRLRFTIGGIPRGQEKARQELITQWKQQLKEIKRIEDAKTSPRYRKSASGQKVRDQITHLERTENVLHNLAAAEKKADDERKSGKSLSSETQQNLTAARRALRDEMQFFKFDIKSLSPQKTSTPPVATNTPAAATATPTTTTPHAAGQAVSLPSSFVCMYAGFIIKNSPCRAPSRLPDNMNLLDLDAESFTCKSPQIMCNPLIFGGLISCSAEEAAKNKACIKELKPLCIVPSLSATNDCAQKSQKDPRGLASAAVLIQQNPQIWDEYTQSFQILCDQGKIDHRRYRRLPPAQRQQREAYAKADVERTCDWARTQLTKLKNDYKIDTKAIDKTKLEGPKGQR